jgi:molecular chaperone GrpE (heat shock protein)
MSSLTEITLQLIYKKLEEILDAIQSKEKSITQEQFNAAMKEVMKVVNKKENK